MKVNFSAAVKEGGGGRACEEPKLLIVMNMMPDYLITAKMSHVCIFLLAFQMNFQQLC